MLYLCSWLLPTVFFVFLSLKNMKRGWGITISIIIVIIELFLCGISLLGFVFDDNIGISMTYIAILQMMLCTIYKFKNISSIEKTLGLLVFVGLCVFMYYYGSVVGELEYVISDAGGMHRKTSYNIYRWSVYTFDVLLLWFPLFNWLISPFWMRKPNSTNYITQLINKVSEN